MSYKNNRLIYRQLCILTFIYNLPFPVYHIKHEISIIKLKIIYINYYINQTRYAFKNEMLIYIYLKLLAENLDVRILITGI